MKRSAMVMVALAAFCISTSAYASSSPDDSGTGGAVQVTASDEAGSVQTAESPTNSDGNPQELPQIDPDP